MKAAQQTDPQRRAQRNAELAAIHVRAKRLRLDDAAYRGLLERLTGHRSSADLNAEQRRLVLDALKSYATPTPRRPGPDEPQIAMLRSLWTEAFFRGLVKSPAERALTAFVRRVTGVDAIRWLAATDANKAIEGLKVMIARHRRRRNSQ